VVPGWIKIFCKCIRLRMLPAKLPLLWLLALWSGRRICFIMFSPKWNFLPFTPCSSRKAREAVLVRNIFAICSMLSLYGPFLSPSGLFALLSYPCCESACAFCGRCDMIEGKGFAWNKTSKAECLLHLPVEFKRISWFLYYRGINVSNHHTFSV